jgi:hypothetical protein
LYFPQIFMALLSPAASHTRLHLSLFSLEDATGTAEGDVKSKGRFKKHRKDLGTLT